MTYIHYLKIFRASDMWELSNIFSEFSQSWGSGDKVKPNIQFRKIFLGSSGLIYGCYELLKEIEEMFPDTFFHLMKHIRGDHLVNVIVG